VRDSCACLLACTPARLLENEGCEATYTFALEFNDLRKVAAAYPLSPTNTKHQCNTGIRFEFVLDLF
jgi:hypothetical protein